MTAAPRAIGQIVSLARARARIVTPAFGENGAVGCDHQVAPNRQLAVGIDNPRLSKVQVAGDVQDDVRGVWRLPNLPLVSNRCDAHNQRNQRASGSLAGNRQRNQLAWGTDGR